MANAFVSTTELLQLGDGNISDIDVTELLLETPFLAAMPAIVASNETSHEWLKKTASPAAGFRAINDGMENTKATYTKVTHALKLFDAGFDIDLGLMATKSGMALLTREAKDHLAEAFKALEKQLFYGTTTGGNASGFAGLSDSTAVDAIADSMVVNAGGTTVATASTVWAVRLGESAVSVVYGLNGRVEVQDSYKVLRDGSSTGSYDALRTPILFYAGLQLATNLDVGRIVNLTADSGKGLTDSLLSSLYNKFPANRRPTHFVMNRRSHEQLQKSRTATTTTGAPAPYPSESFNVPIIVTDQINSTDALVA